MSLFFYFETSLGFLFSEDFYAEINLNINVYVYVYREIYVDKLYIQLLY